MIVPQNATNLILLLRLLDANGDAVTGVAKESVTLVSLSYGDATWQPITLVNGTAGTYVTNGWIELGNGEYQFCPDNALIVAGRTTQIRATVGSNPVQYGAIEAASGGGGVTGPNVISVTVQDDDTDAPIEAALVRFYKTGDTGTKSTDASGETQFAVDSATWNVATSAAGYAGDVQTVVVSGDATLVIVLTATSITVPTDPTASTLVVKAIDADLSADADVEIHVRMAAVPTGDTGLASPGTQRTKTTPANGIVEFTCQRLAVYEVRRGDSKQWTTVTIADAASTSMPSLIGGA